MKNECSIIAFYQRHSLARPWKTSLTSIKHKLNSLRINTPRKLKQPRRLSEGAVHDAVTGALHAAHHVQ
ncbi:hypothetical protein [Paraburkholderia sp. IW21]|uniref:hypothetical protein n=1 Tax=Paraburkholderia sp. IW21 TaxID=3242488 RepID=UPI0035205D72